MNYVGFINDEKVKIQIFISGLPSFYSENIQYDNPETLDEAIRRAKNIYEKRKGRPIFQKYWNDKIKSKKEKRKNILRCPF
jgi:hypothetical protein